MASPIQEGQDLEIGFGNYEWSGYVPEDGLTVVRNFNEKEIHKDLSGATRNKIRMDGFTSLQAVFVIDAGDAVQFRDGDRISVKPPSSASATVWEINDPSTAHAPGAIKLTATLLKEESMTYVVPT